MKELIVQCLPMFPTVLRLKKMYDKAVGTYSNMLKCVPDYLKTQEMCRNAVKIEVCNNVCS